MATKKKTPKKKAAKRPTTKRSAKRPAALAPTIAPSASVKPKRNGLWLAILVVALLLAIFWRSRHQAHHGEEGHGHGALSVPASKKAADGRSPSPAAAKSAATKPGQAPAPQAQPTARREAADEVGAPALEFDRANQKTLSVRCWRPANGQAQLDVFGPRNQRVRTLRSENGAAGWQSLDWDGKDEQGRKVPAGLYYVRPSAQDLQEVRDVWVKG